jgi:hypothetical protein
LQRDAKSSFWKVNSNTAWNFLAAAGAFDKGLKGRIILSSAFFSIPIFHLANAKSNLQL